MALSSQTLSSQSFKRDHQKINGGCSARWLPNKRAHCLKAAAPIYHHYYYYSSSDEEDDTKYSSESETEEVSKVERPRRFSLPYKKNRVFSISKSSMLRRNSKCLGESFLDRKIEQSTNNSNNNKTEKVELPVETNSENNISSAPPTNSNNSSTTNLNSSEQSGLAHSDTIARARCFDYLMGAIDEAWARYCDTTSFAEDKLYNSMKVCNEVPATPVSEASSDYDSDYKSDVTDLTEYESEFECIDEKKVSQQPESIKIQNLKDRLIKAKNYLQDFVESDNINDCLAFWARWDLIKYATIELVEDDDDDELIEDTIEDLEKGRCY